MLLLVVEGEADSGRWMKRDVGICQHDERVLAFLLRMPWSYLGFS